VREGASVLQALHDEEGSRPRGARIGRPLRGATALSALIRRRCAEMLAARPNHRLRPPVRASGGRTDLGDGIRPLPQDGQVTFWIWSGFPRTPAPHARLRRAEG